jgi:hypothetical protein
MTPGFEVTQNKGFRMTFANGWAVSVQWGPGNYCERRDYAVRMDMPSRKVFWSSSTAEVAVIAPDGTLAQLTPHDTVQGWQTPDQVLYLMRSVAEGTFLPAVKETFDDE